MIVVNCDRSIRLFEPSEENRIARRSVLPTAGSVTDATLLNRSTHQPVTQRTVGIPIGTAYDCRNISQIDLTANAGSPQQPRTSPKPFPTYSW